MPHTSTRLQELLTVLGLLDDIAPSETRKSCNRLVGSVAACGARAAAGGNAVVKRGVLGAALLPGATLVSTCDAAIANLDRHRTVRAKTVLLADSKI